MSIIEDKIQISADGAELINNYLNKLTKKLVEMDIDEVYSIVSEAEMLFISSIKKLSKRSKATIDEVQNILANHGTVDEVIQRYVETIKFNQYHEFERFNYRSKQLIRRRSTQEYDIKKSLKSISETLLKVSLVIPIFINLFLIFTLNQYRGENYYILKAISNSEINEDVLVSLLVISSLIFVSHEGYSGNYGKLFVSAQTSIKIRSVTRNTLAVGTFISFYLLNIGGPRYFDERSLENKSLMWTFIICYIFLELIIFIRDHVSSFYLLQPSLPDYLQFVKLPYIMLYLSCVLLYLSITTSYELIIIVYLFSSLALFSSWFKKYSLGINFYIYILLLPLLSTTLVLTTISITYESSLNLDWFIFGLQLVIISSSFIFPKNSTIVSQVKKSVRDLYELII